MFRTGSGGTRQDGQHRPSFAFLNKFDLHDPCLPLQLFRSAYSTMKNPSGAIDTFVGRFTSMPASSKLTSIKTVTAKRILWSPGNRKTVFVHPHEPSVKSKKSTGGALFQSWALPMITRLDVVAPKQIAIAMETGTIGAVPNCRLKADGDGSSCIARESPRLSMSKQI